MSTACEKLITLCSLFLFSPTCYGLERGMVDPDSHALHERGGPPHAFSKPKRAHVYKQVYGLISERIFKCLDFGRRIKEKMAIWICVCGSVEVEAKMG